MAKLTNKEDLKDYMSEEQIKEHFDIINEKTNQIKSTFMYGMIDISNYITDKMYITGATEFVELIEVERLYKNLFDKE